ncbi:branched-chain-amino-acid aminotransferase, cytosolic-like [Asterias rubens]|uniref:branched-chain-amino-acid aminotransferase, cytosolic-like n=1 Tax=Asterias rubens TaxID=7604 RepID=UPI0014552B66|nr:branched-chain-amino-acid aminotransferase, cytosolic-like [Asterias rubens]
MAGVFKVLCQVSHKQGRRVAQQPWISHMTRRSLASFKASDLQIQLSTELKQKPDPNNLVFGKEFTDHMLVVDWTKDGGWTAPTIIPFGNLSIHPASSSLHYAIELFEGMKAYRGVDDTIRLFRPYSNMDRMSISAARCALPAFDKDELLKCMSELIRVDRDWVPHSTTSSLYIRPTMIGTEPSLGVSPPTQAKLFVIIGPVGPYFSTGTFNPVRLYADTEHVRAWKGGVGYAKLGSNYGPTIMPQVSAINNKGCQQILWLYEDEHYVTEVGTMNIMMYWKNEQGEDELVTPALDGTILPGVTRKSLLELARKWGEFKVSERPFTMKDLVKGVKENRIYEIFGAGTACVVCPVSSILYKDEDLEIPTMKNGAKLATRFYNELNDIQYGRVQNDWMYNVD